MGETITHDSAERYAYRPRVQGDLMKHTLHHNILGSAYYDIPTTWTFVYADGREVTFTGITELKAMRTGCYVLYKDHGTRYSIPLGYLYVTIEEESA